MGKSIIIDNHALQISCFQINPGAEQSVAKNLSDRCIHAGIERYCLLKGFGTFDIILINEAPNFEYQWVDGTPIDGVTKSSKFPCFSYNGLSSGLMDALNTHAFIGISFLKLNRTETGSYQDLKLRLLKSFITENKKIESFVVGTFGWHEMILITCSDDIECLLGNFFWSTHDAEPIILKTLSLMCLNHRDVFLSDSSKKSFNSIYKSLSSKPCLNVSITNQASPLVFISAQPAFTDEIVRFWTSRKFITKELIGKEDIAVFPPKDATWAYFMAGLIYFRHKLSKKAISTKTRIFQVIKRAPRGSSIKMKTLRRHLKYNEFKFVSLFGKSNASVLINTINYIHGLLQHSVYSDTLSDLIPYIDNIIYIAQKAEDVGDATEFANQASEVLKFGAELRNYGTYGILEEPSAQSSLLKGAIQRVLVALEAIPTAILNRRFGACWDGFVISSVHKFSTIDEVINIPIDLLFIPSSWWAIYHEIAHIYIDNNPRILSPEIDEIKMFMVNRDPQDWWFTLLNEIAAEIIGYVLGFYSDFDFYLEKVWKYLSEEHGSNPDLVLDPYYVRTFVVDLFRQGLPIKSGADISETLDHLYISFLSHLEKIETILSSSGFKIENKEFVASRNIKAIKDLYPYLNYLSAELSKYKLPQVDELCEENTLLVIQFIERGEIWFDHICFPEAVLFHFFKNLEISFNQEIALILSLWNVAQLTPPEERVYD